MFSTPTVAGDLLFVGSCNGFYRALDKRTGEVVWAYDTRVDGVEAEFHGDPLVTEELVIVGSDLRQPSATGHLYAFERTTGQARWKYPVPYGVVADVLRLGSRIYAVTFEDKLVCLDLETGRELWTFSSAFSNKDFVFNSTPAAAHEEVFFGGLDGVIYALEAISGKLTWKRDLGARISTSVLLLGDNLYLGATNQHLYRLEKKTGAILADLALEGQPLGRLAAAGDSLFAFLSNNALACLDPSLKGLRWSQKPQAPPSWSSTRPYLWKETVVAGNEQGEVFAFRVTDGQLQWSEKFEGLIRGIGTSPEALYVGTLKGMVYAWAPPSAESPP